MNIRLFLWAVGSSLAIGFSVGVTLTAADRPFVLEAADTPFGSYVLRYNPPQDTLLHAPAHPEQGFDLVA